jgi:hypothetical protein
MKVAGCRWRPLPENSTAPKRSTAHKTLIFHSAVGSSSPWGYFARASTVTESHGWTGLDGKSEQFLDDTLRADAQWDANPWAWSWETADNGHPDEFEWTPAQVEELARIAAWFHINRGVPLRLCRSWDDDGIGYHRQFKQWNHSGHTCPGTVRVKQIPAIIARAIEIVEGDMPLTSDDVTKVWNQDGSVDNQGGTAEANPKTSGATALEATWANARAAAIAAKDARDNTEDIKAAVAKIPTSVAALSTADRAAIAQQVAALIPKPATAAEIAAELARRLQA